MDDDGENWDKRSVSSNDDPIDDYVAQATDSDVDEYLPDPDDEEECIDFDEEPLDDEFVSVDKKKRKWKFDVDKGIRKKQKTNSSWKHRVYDDGDKSFYEKRLKKHDEQNALLSLDQVEDYTVMHQIVDELQMPLCVWNKLYHHQQEAVKWMWTRHISFSGGILGDEMGLGKTIEVIAFLMALRSTTLHRPGHPFLRLASVLLICPVTVMHQWVSEFHKWWPLCRVCILHKSGSFQGKPSKLIDEVYAKRGVLIVSYDAVMANIKEINKKYWHYVVLDEGHKIRNPDLRVTTAVKLLQTPHRLLLSATPIQNNLRELWSLIDFICPNLLGSEETFMKTVAWHIRVGCYARASQLEVEVARRCTMMLRDTIQPCLLRRTKQDVNDFLHLPPKNEQALFITLTDEQRQLYLDYLQSDPTSESQFKSARTKMFTALTKLRKICNHPYIFSKSSCEGTDPSQKSFYAKSGKMIVLRSLLKLWYKQGHKVLVFTQSRKMLDILERFMQYREYSYLRMDGSTSILARHAHIKQFNSSSDTFVFLLTTKVGGLGLNLTGANRVIIFDPDWNPCTDIQARERCWRIGQNKDVTIYRFLSAGTVEEKMYHRQIFKQYLSNRVLHNTEHQRFFKQNDLKELFTLGEDAETQFYFDDTNASRYKKDKSQKFKQLHAHKKRSQVKPKPDSLLTFGGASTSLGRVFNKNGTTFVNVSNMPKIPKKKNKNDDTKAAVQNEENGCTVDFTDGIISQIENGLIKPEVDSDSNTNDTLNGDSDPTSVEKQPTDDLANSSTLSEKENTILSPEEVLTQQKRQELLERAKFLSKNFHQILATSKTSSDKDQKKKDKKSKKLGIRLEHHKIDHLVCKEPVVLTEAEEKKKQKDQAKEDYMLQTLLGKSINTIMHVDQIEAVTPDFVYIEEKAKKVANEAMAKLRHQTFEKITTEADDPYDFLRAGPSTSSSNNNDVRVLLQASDAARLSSGGLDEDLDDEPLDLGETSVSASIIASIQKKMATYPSAADELESMPESFMPDDEVLFQMHNYMLAQPKFEATTDQLVAHFDRRIRPQQTIIFRTLLKQLCTFSKDSKSGRKKWKLRKEFQKQRRPV